MQGNGIKSKSIKGTVGHWESFLQGSSEKPHGARLRIISPEDTEIGAFIHHIYTFLICGELCLRALTCVQLSKLP